MPRTQIQDRQERGEEGRSGGNVRPFVPQPRIEGKLTLPSRRVHVEGVCLGGRDKNWHEKRCEDRFVDLQSRPRRCEDIMLAVPHVVGVIDGATSADPSREYGALSSAEFAAQIVRRFLTHRASEQIDAERMLFATNARLHDVLVRLEREPDYAAGPSAAVAFAALYDNDTFQVAAVADCMALGLRKDGGWEEFTYDRLPAARRFMEETVAPNASGIDEAEKARRRARLNDPIFRRRFLYQEHISVVNGDPRFGEKPGLIQLSGVRKLSDYVKLVFMSDGGFYPLVQQGESPSLTSCKQLAETGFDLNRHAGNIFNMRQQQRYVDLGGKAFDDLTLMVVSL